MWSGSAVSQLPYLLGSLAEYGSEILLRDGQSTTVKQKLHDDITKNVHFYKFHVRVVFYVYML